VRSPAIAARRSGRKFGCHWLLANQCAGGTGPIDYRLRKGALVGEQPVAPNSRATSGTQQPVVMGEDSRNISLSREHRQHARRLQGYKTRRSPRRGPDRAPCSRHISPRLPCLPRGIVKVANAGYRPVSRVNRRSYSRSIRSDCDTRPMQPLGIAWARCRTTPGLFVEWAGS
jgi:hypothetical protein